MTVVSNASPLIALARIGQLGALGKLYGTVHIPTEVHDEVVVAGAGMPGALAVCPRLIGSKFRRCVTPRL